MMRISMKCERKGSIGTKLESGRLGASTCKDDYRPKLTVLEERKTTFTKMSKKFITTNGNSLSGMTISRRLNEIGFSFKKICDRKPLLTKRNITERKIFAFNNGKMQSVLAMLSGLMNRKIVSLLIPKKAY